MKNKVSKEIALSVLKAIFAAGDVKKLSKMRGVILCGYPGCGKTTIAQLLHDAFGFEILSTDQIRVNELFKGQHHRQASEHERVMVSRYLVYEELARRVNRRLNSRQRVVVDGTNLDPKRWSILGGMLTKIPQEKIVMIVIRTPEWIIKKRFMNWGKKRYDNWWSVYKYWRNYVKEGRAKFPTKSELPKVQIIKPRRYAIRTFDWVPEIKAIGWDLDGTLYPKKAIPSRWFTQRQYQAVAEKMGWSVDKAKKEYKKRLEKFGSNTRTLFSFGIDGAEYFSQLWEKIDLSLYLKKDQKIIKMIRKLKDIRQFILSNSNSLAIIEQKLKLIGLKPKQFEMIFSTLDIGGVKPEPKPFRVALKRMGLKPEEVLYVGDRVETDIVGAKNVGMRTCLVGGVSQYADVSLKNVYEVAGLFGKEI